MHIALYADVERFQENFDGNKVTIKISDKEGIISRLFYVRIHHQLSSGIPSTGHPT